MNSLNVNRLPAERAASLTKASCSVGTLESNDPGAVENTMRDGRRQISNRCYRYDARIASIEVKGGPDGQRYENLF